jgi:hypothetical protein
MTDVEPQEGISRPQEGIGSAVTRGEADAAKRMAGADVRPFVPASESGILFGILFGAPTPTSACAPG